MQRTVRNENARVDYILIQTSRRNVQIKALPGGETRVYAPAWMRLRDVDAIVSKKIDAIVRMHKALDRAVNADHAAHPVGEGKPDFRRGNAEKTAFAMRETDFDEAFGRCTGAYASAPGK